MHILDGYYPRAPKKPIKYLLYKKLYSFLDYLVNQPTPLEIMGVLRYNIIIMSYYFNNSKKSLVRCLQVVFVFLGTASMLGAQSYIYWANRSANTIQRSGLDGSNITTMVSGLSSPRDVAYDPVGNKKFTGLIEEPQKYNVLILMEAALKMLLSALAVGFVNSR